MESLGRVLQAVAADEPHRVERPAVGVRAQAVDRHDAGMLQAAGDLRLQQEARPAVGVVGVPLQDLLERHLAVQLLVVGDEDLAQAAWACGRRMRKRWPAELGVPTTFALG